MILASPYPWLTSNRMVTFSSCSHAAWPHCLAVLPQMKLLPKSEVCLKMADTQRISFPLRSDSPSAALSRPGTRREPAEPGLDGAAIMRPGGARKCAWTVTVL